MDPATDVVHLTHDELLALAASLRVMMRADGAVTETEIEIVSNFANRLGVTEAKWEIIWDEAIRSIPDKKAIAAAASVTRTEAREMVYQLLYELATDDSIVDAEWDLLEWLDETWLANP